uniref:Fe2OG dioxygenase domain-containing protein n=1 Tax=Lygus hesperus TaxID=30085 RepID=A0A0K8SQD1_LYGHE
MEASMFKSQFKYYRNKANKPNERELGSCLTPRPTHGVLNDISEQSLKDLGLTDPTQWTVFEHNQHPGLLVVKNVFSNDGQYYWIHRCVVDYPAPPNLNNLSPIGLLSNDENWYDVCLNYSARKSAIFRKLRWVTLGYHHNWDTKVYSDDRRSPFPQDLARLCEIVARVVTGCGFSAEAAIVNYYYHSSTISGHTDHSEPNVDAPLLSFSFGDSAIFLIGGASHDDPASPILIESGDVVIMSGPSRLSVHGVPRILPAKEHPWEQLNNNAKADPHRDIVTEFISQARVNMNVRQVLFPGEKTLNGH